MSAIDGPAGRHSVRNLLAQFHEAMIALDFDGFAELHAVDALYEFPLLTPGRPERYQGRAEIRAGFEKVWTGAASRLRVTQIRRVVVHETTDPEVLVVEHEAAATLTATGDRVLVPSLVVIKARDGLLTHVRDYSAGTRRPDTSNASGTLLTGGDVN